jgi:pimeloyl-ACP methyl ester carboxylesterase
MVATLLINGTEDEA